MSGTSYFGMWHVLQRDAPTGHGRSDRVLVG
jgi:hypothetical protein